MARTLEQERAAFALAQIEKVRKLGKAEQAKYKSQLLKLPARLHNNGLGQTVAFYLSAGSGKPEAEICRWLQDWLSKSISGRPPIYPSGKDLVQVLAGNGLSQDDDAESKYREASAEVRSLAVWLKRFTEAFVEGGDEGK